MKKSLFFLASFLLATVSNCTAQNTIGMNASMFNAQGEFNNNIDNDPIGISFTYIYNLEEGPWSIGGELGIAMYSSKEFKTLDSTGDEINVYEEDCFYNAHAITHYQLLDVQWMEAYGEGRIGVTSFFSEQHATGDEETDFEPIYETHGTAFNVGIGGGVRLNLSGLFRGNAERNDRVWLDVSMTSNSGSRARYRNATKEDTQLSEGNYKSLTDYTHLRVGVNVQF